VVSYMPEPIDTSHVDFDPDLEELVEKLAENNHDHWALKRIEEGWRYGARRSDDRKEPPDLVPGNATLLQHRANCPQFPSFPLPAPRPQSPMHLRPLLHPHTDRTPRLDRDHLHGHHLLIRLK
jgi:hypothetical protein